MFFQNMHSLAWILIREINFMCKTTFLEYDKNGGLVQGGSDLAQALSCHTFFPGFLAIVLE